MLVKHHEAAIETPGFGHVVDLSPEIERRLDEIVSFIGTGKDD